MRIKSYRLLSQIIFLVLSVIGVAGITKTGIIFPFFFCNASPGAVCVCPLWVLEHGFILLQIDHKQALAMLFFLFGFLGMIGFFVGRSFCGWACPIGFLQDIAKQFRGKIKLEDYQLYGIFIFGVLLISTVYAFPNVTTGYLGTAGVALMAVSLYGILNRLDNSILTTSVLFLSFIGMVLIRLYLWEVAGVREVYFFIVLVMFFISILVLLRKYVLPAQSIIRDTKFYYQNRFYLVKYIILFLIPITSYIFVDKWFTNIDPVGGLTAGIPTLMFENDQWNVSFLLWVKFILIGLMFWLMIITTRGFCRFICPVGALMAPTNKISIQNITYYPENCIKCNKCIKACPMNINVINMKRDMECIRCGRCVDKCDYDALHMTVMRKVIK
jgi:polyferredoxin